MCHSYQLNVLPVQHKITQSWASQMGWRKKIKLSVMFSSPQKVQSVQDVTLRRNRSVHSANLFIKTQERL